MPHHAAIDVLPDQVDGEQVMAWSRDHNFRNYGRLPAVMVRGEGVYLWDAGGKRYLDWESGGRAGNALGHANPVIAAAVKSQVDRLAYISNDFYNYPQARLAAALAETGPCTRAFFCNSGAEANETAIKLVRKWAKRKKGEGATEIVTALKSFHGRTLGALTATGQPKFQSGFEPLPGGFTHVPFNDVAALESAVGPQTAGVMLEPVLGESGIHPATRDFLHAARQLCDRHGALLVMDEVQTGFGRTGKFWAWEHFGAKPDVIACAKTMGGGLPLGVCLATEDASTGIGPGDHGCTFGGNPLACTAGLAALKLLRDDGLVEQAVLRGDYLRRRLDALAARTGAVTEIRSLGLMAGLDLRQPVAFDVMKACLADGLVISASSENTLRLLPALIIEDAQIDEGIVILERQMGKAGAGA